MPEIPAEMWLYIASFLPNNELLPLMGVNIYFYNHALQLRYGTIRVESVNAYTVRLLDRLRFHL